ncbi:2-methylaconitate cis-trans isomerase PrpF family protein [Roseicyclus marinus]|uniref:2-methylaconitate cis-trans isomerase PrpF family protein n=1 Tax=Roseicyclus marinus TaxID=2161673 RepID=UPI00241056A2|nr:PrpF domain-containing protein [Roseicyclus marinus]MDG3040950.1 PrpF domain-containing protein [Roseicyclus marinus]
MTNQIRIPAVFMRGGTSKAIIFHGRDLPSDIEEHHRIFLSALGSPDPGKRQLDGMGGGLSSLSKICVIDPPSRPDADVDYTFVQIPVTDGPPDYSSNCGNMSSAIGPFAVEEGLVCPADGAAVVRIHNTNTGKIIESRFEVRGGLPVVTGDFVNPGVAGTGARIRLDFVDPAGAATGRLLPTGKTTDSLDVPGLPAPVEVSLIDATNPVVFLRAEALGLTGYETPDQIETASGIMEALEAIRCAGSIAMGLTNTMEAAHARAGSPKIGMVAAPRDYRSTAGETLRATDFDLAIRMISMGQAHRAVTLTGSMCTAVAASLTGSCVAALARPPQDGILRLGHASGVMPAMADVRHTGDGWQVAHATVFRTARRLMEGSVTVPPRPKADDGTA